MASAQTRSIRFPPALREQLVARAKVERRSFSSQVLLLCERGLAASEAEQQEVERLAEIARRILSEPSMTGVAKKTLLEVAAAAIGRPLAFTETLLRDEQAAGNVERLGDGRWSSARESLAPFLPTNWVRQTGHERVARPVRARSGLHVCPLPWLL